MHKLLEGARYSRAQLPGDPVEPNTPSLRRYSHVSSVKGAFRSSFGDFPSMRRATESEIVTDWWATKESQLEIEPPNTPPPPPPIEREDDLNPVLDIISLANDDENIDPDPEDPSAELEEDAHNWMLKDRGPSLRSASVTASSASIMNLNETIGKKKSRFWKDSYWTADQRRASIGRAPSLTRGLVKSNSMGNCLETGSSPSTKYENYVNEWEAIKSLSRHESFREEHESECCCCSNKPKSSGSNRDSGISFTSVSSSTPQVRFSEQSQAQWIYDETTADPQTKSIEIVTANEKPIHEPSPNEQNDIFKRASLRSNISLRSSKTSLRRNSNKSWESKRLKQWNMDDVLTWLQVVGLDHVASILIGYDLTGADLLTWDNETLEVGN